MLEGMLFFFNWLKKPKEVGTLLPTPSATGDVCFRAIVNFARTRKVDWRTLKILEIGPGTGVITKRLLFNGVECTNLMLLEINGELCDFLRKNFEHVPVVEGDANRVELLCQEGVIFKPDIIISGVPLLLIPLEQRKKMIDGFLNLVTDAGVVLQYGYNPVKSINKFFNFVNYQLVGKVWHVLFFLKIILIYRR